MNPADTESVGSVSLEEALAWIAEMFEEPAGRLDRETPRSEIEAWDSLGQLVLMSGLDQRFGIQLSQEELSSLASVGDILHALKAHNRLLDA